MITASSERISRVGLIGALRSLFLSLLALLSPLFAQQASYCAFEVLVKSPSGAPVPNVPVIMVKNHTTTFSQTTTAANGVARLCDAPLEAVDIVAGFDLCGSIMVRSIRPTWPLTKSLSITYAETSCGHFTFADHCEVLLRVRDENKKPISGAHLVLQEKSMRDSSDEFGRLFLALKKGEKIEGKVVIDRREPASISETCGPFGDELIEKVIILRRR